MYFVQPDLFGPDQGGPDYPTYSGALKKHPLYWIWSGLKQRCYNPRATRFNNYGARGIAVCNAWRRSSRSFIDWALANGYAQGLQIDRIDNDGDYSPANCHFVTPRENQNNRSDTIRLSNGQPISFALDNSELSQTTIRCRRYRGWTPDEAISLPRHSRRPRTQTNTDSP